MITKSLIEIIERDLYKLKDEINLYNDEKKLWIIAEGINNSAGNLALHLIGNLNHYIGAIIGKSGYVRERDKEFSDKNISKSDILKKIDQTIEVIKASLQSIKDEELYEVYPVDVLKKKI